jgi:hypothetical protein
MRHLIRPLTLWLCCALAASAVAEPKLPHPPKSRIGLLGEEMVFNGIPMEIRQFQSGLSVAEILEYYGQVWPAGTEKEPGYVVSDALKPWTIITRSEDGYLMTVQVTAEGGGSRGFLAKSHMDGALEQKREFGGDFPVMHGSSPMNDVRTADAGKDGRTLAFVNDRTPEANADYYRTWFASRGWTQDMDKSPGSAGHVLSFRNGDKSVNIVINGRADRTYIVAQTTNFDKHPW